MNIRCSELYPLSGQAHPFIAVLAKTAKDDGYRLMRIGISLLLIWIVLLDGFCRFLSFLQSMKINIKHSLLRCLKILTIAIHIALNSA